MNLTPPSPPYYYYYYYMSKHKERKTETERDGVKCYIVITSVSVAAAHRVSRLHGVQHASAQCSVRTRGSVAGSVQTSRRPRAASHDPVLQQVRPRGASPDPVPRPSRPRGVARGLSPPRVLSPAVGASARRRVIAAANRDVADRPVIARVTAVTTRRPAPTVSPTAAAAASAAPAHTV